eukprot:jgi/Galph1/2735/GphlegSOOS_G1436.1
MDPNWKSVSELSQAIQTGTLTCKDLVLSCIKRIQERQEQIYAWVSLKDKDTLLKEAEQLDKELTSTTISTLESTNIRGRSLLHGIPVGIKDVIETKDLPTCCGYSEEYLAMKDKSSIYTGKDAAIVAQLREAGAIIIGKTVTTEFGVSMDATVTRNPHLLSHSPGGSSSGSAAAVADGMVPFAVGAQTAGSVVRPAAFCGIIGYKASYNKLDLTGVRPVAESIDSLGIFVRNIDDIPLIMKSIGAWKLEEFLQTESTVDHTNGGKVSPTFAFCKTPFWDNLPEYYTRAISRVLEKLKNRLSIRELHLPEPFMTVFENHQHVMFWEVTQVFHQLEQLSQDGNYWPEDIPVGPFIRSIPELAHSYGENAYRSVLRTANLLRQILSLPAETGQGLLYQNEVILCPATSGEAPPISIETQDSESSSGSLSPVLGKFSDYGGKPGTTGDSLFQRGWTLLHCPAVSIPIGKGPRGLPLAIQLVAPAGQDEKLIQAAKLFVQSL